MPTDTAHAQINAGRARAVTVRTTDGRRGADATTMTSTGGGGPVCHDT